MTTQADAGGGRRRGPGRPCKPDQEVQPKSLARRAQRAAIAADAWPVDTDRDTSGADREMSTVPFSVVVEVARACLPNATASRFVAAVVAADLRLRLARAAEVLAVARPDIVDGRLPGA